mgnify:CR=1 FL=1
MTMTSQDTPELVERVARAIWDTWSDAPFDPACDDWDTRESLKKARAAIEAMREPTTRMVQAHAQECAGDADEAGPKRIAAAWRAMIDAALEPRR